MSDQYDDTNRGQIWPNERKATDKHPDFTGSLDVNGTKYWVSAWKRRPDANPKAPSLSFSIKLKDEQPQSGADQTQAGGGPNDDDIPF